MIEPASLTKFAAAGLRVWTVSRDGERPVLLIADEESGILITPKSGTVEAAILGFERLESAAKEMAAELRGMAGAPHTRTTGTAEGDSWRSQSASGSK